MLSGRLLKGEAIFHGDTFFILGVQDLWTPIPANLTQGVSIDMLVGPKHSPYVVKFLNCSGVPYDITIHDIQRVIDEGNEVTESSTRIANQGKTIVHFRFRCYSS